MPRTVRSNKFRLPINLVAVAGVKILNRYRPHYCYGSSESATPHTGCLVVFDEFYCFFSNNGFYQGFGIVIKITKFKFCLNFINFIDKTLFILLIQYILFFFITF